MTRRKISAMDLQPTMAAMSKECDVAEKMMALRMLNGHDRDDEVRNLGETLSKLTAGTLTALNQMKDSDDYSHCNPPPGSALDRELTRFTGLCIRRCALVQAMGDFANNTGNIVEMINIFNKASL